jgi:hypothetical protein
MILTDNKTPKSILKNYLKIENRHIAMKKVTPSSIRRIDQRVFWLLVLLFVSFQGFSQNVGINATGALPNSAAGLDVDFPDKGILIPRVALTGTANFAPLTAHIAGMIVYNTAAAGDVKPGFYYNNGTKWIPGFLEGSNVGDMLYWNGTTWITIPVGVSGQYLQLSAASIPTWGGAVIATLSTNAATAITATTATSGGNITADGGSAVLMRGICWGINPSPTIANSKTTDALGGLGTFSNNMTGLLSGTTYYVRSYAINSSSVSYGNEISFITVASVPSVAATTAATLITATTATTGGNVTANGGSAILERGVCYGTTSNPTIAGNKLIDPAPGVGTFTSNLTALAGGTTYYVRAYATNAIGTTYGTQISFTTTVTPPTLVTAAPTNITGASATSGGSMTWNGGGYSNFQNYGVAYSLIPGSATPTFVATNTTNGSVNPAVPIAPWVTNITGLASNTTYYIRSYLNLWRTSTSSWITVFGNELTLTTTAPSAPVVATTTAITSITTASANSGGNIISDGGAAITARGLCYGTSPAPTIANNVTVNGTGIGAFTASMSLLSPSTQYYVRAYATNSVGTSYGNEQVFSTCGTPVYSIGQSVAGGIVYYVDCTGTSGLIVSTVDLGTNVAWGCSGTLTGASGTAIYTGLANTNAILAACATPGIPARVCADYTAGGINIPNFTNWYLPSRDELQLLRASGMANPPSALYSTWSSTEGSATLAAGWYFNGNYQVSIVKTSANQNVFRAVRKFTVPAFTTPTLSTAAVTSITGTTATSGGDITTDGGAPVITSGVCWNTAPTPTIANSFTTDGTTSGVYSSQLTGLTANTLYYVRAYATNAAGTAYGNEISFTTTAPTAPIINTEPISAQTSTSGTSGGTIVSDGGSPITVSGICWSTNPSPTTADPNTTDGTTTGTFLSDATGLTAGTLYYIRAYATNAVNTSYGNQISFTPSPAGFPEVTTDPILNLAGSLAEGQGTVVSDGGNPITSAGLVWGLSADPTIDVNLGMTADGWWPFQFYSVMTGLTVGTEYHVRAYATNSAGTSYGSDLIFTATAATVGQMLSGGNLWGIIYSVDGTGNHGLIADFGTINMTDWGCANSVTGARGTAVGTGSANSDAIIADIVLNNCTSVSGPLGFAPQMIKDYYGPDWYLPSKDEFNLLWTNRVAAGLEDGFTFSASQTYWSSSEVDATNAWYLDVTNPLTPVWNNTGLKNALYSIWMIRAF